MSDKPIAYRASTYAWMIQHITIIARLRGYAIGLHGSMHNDLDLIAVPWVEDACPAEELVEAIRNSVDGEIKQEISGKPYVNPSDKPHGRRAWTIHFSGCAFYIDLSVMPMAARPAAER